MFYCEHSWYEGYMSWHLRNLEDATLVLSVASRHFTNVIRMLWMLASLIRRNRSLNASGYGAIVYNVTRITKLVLSSANNESWRRRSIFFLCGDESSTHKSLASERLSYRTVIMLNICYNRRSCPRFNFNPVSINSLLFLNFLLAWHMGQ